MADFCRNSVFGLIVRFSTGNKYTSFPSDEHHYTPDKTDNLADNQGSLTHDPAFDLQKRKRDVLVDWNDERDPQNPQTWSIKKKVFVASLICLYTFTVYCGSSIFVPSEAQVVNAFHVSEAVASLGLALYVRGYGIGPLLFSPLSEIPCIGRNPVYLASFVIFVLLSIGISITKSFASFLVLRFLQCFFGSPCLATGAAPLGDMFAIIKIPYSLAAWSGSMYCGPALGPFISAFVVTAEGWRWSMWEIVWLSGFVLFLLLVCLPEISAPTILYYKTQRLRNAAGCLDFVSKSMSKMKSLRPSQIVKLALIKPFEITLKDPAIASTNIYVSLTYGIYYSFFEAFSIVYTDTYGFTLGETAAAFLNVLVVCFLGITIYCSFYRLNEEPRIRRTGTYDRQETFMRPGLAGVFGVLLGLFLFGWTARTSVYWLVPTLGIIMYCGCSFIVGLGIFVDLPLSYPQYAASLFAANNALRSGFACGAILLGRPLYLNLGVGKGCTLLACLSILGIIGHWYLYIYEDKLGRRSKFTSG